MISFIISIIHPPYIIMAFFLFKHTKELPLPSFPSSFLPRTEKIHFFYIFIICSCFWSKMKQLKRQMNNESKREKEMEGFVEGYEYNFGLFFILSLNESVKWLSSNMLFSNHKHNNRSNNTNHRVSNVTSQIIFFPSLFRLSLSLPVLFLTRMQTMKLTWSLWPSQIHLRSMIMILFYVQQAFDYSLQINQRTEERRKKLVEPQKKNENSENIWDNKALIDDEACESATITSIVQQYHQLFSPLLSFEWNKTNIFVPSLFLYLLIKLTMLFFAFFYRTFITWEVIPMR